MPTTQFPNPQARASNGLNPRSLAFDATEDLLPCHHYDARPLTEPPHQSLPMPTTQFPNPQARASNGLNPRSLAFDAPEVLPVTAAPPRSTQASPAMLAASIPLPLIGPGWRVANDKTRLLFISPDLRLFKSSWGGIKYEACRRAKATADVMSTNVDPLTAPMNVSPTHSGEEEVDEAAVQAPTEPATDQPPAGAAALPQILAAAQEPVEDAEGALDDEEVAEQAEGVEEEANGALDDEVMVEQAEAGAAGAAAIPQVLAAAQEPVEDAEGALDDEAEQAEVVEEAELVPAPALPPPLEVEAGGAFNAEVNNNQNEALAMAEVEGEMEHCNLYLL